MTKKEITKRYILFIIAFDKMNKNFGSIKIGFDIICMIIAVVVSLMFFHGKIIRTREGTILSALLMGAVIKIFTSVMKTPLENVVNGDDD